MSTLSPHPPSHHRPPPPPLVLHPTASSADESRNREDGPRRSQSRWNASPQSMRRSEQSILIPALPSCASCPMRARIEILGDANPAREGGCQPPRMRRRRPSFPHPPARSPARSLVARSSFCSPSLPGRMEQSWDTSLWTFAASRSSSLSEFSNM